MVYNDQYSKVIVLTNGHGEFGQYIGNLTYRLLFHYLIHAPLFYTDPLQGLEKVLKRFQRRLNKYVQKKKQEDTYNMLLSGCSITVIIHRDTKLYLGHIGDNRVQIYKEHQSQGKQKKILIEPTPTHSPSDTQEKARIFNSGGEVRKNPSSEEFVFVRGRLYPQLHVTRSIGDTIAHAIGVSAEPFTREYDIIPYDTFLLLSTGPSLMYLDQDEVMNHLTGFTLKTIKSACESLYKQSKSSWIISEGTFDDMCIIMLWLGQLKELK